MIAPGIGRCAAAESRIEAPPKVTGCWNILTAKRLTRWTTARRLSTAPVADSQGPTPAVQRYALARIAKGGGPVPRRESTSLKKPSKIREELESAIRLEMEHISDSPTDLGIRSCRTKIAGKSRSSGTGRSGTRIIAT